jgi:hypothetical protein
LQPEEVAEGSWRHPDTVLELIAANRLCPDSAQAWRMFWEQARDQGDLPHRIAAGSLHPINCAGRQP